MWQTLMHLAELFIFIFSIESEVKIIFSQVGRKCISVSLPCLALTINILLFISPCICSSWVAELPHHSTHQWLFTNLICFSSSSGLSLCVTPSVPLANLPPSHS